MEKPLLLSPILSESGESLNLFYGITDKQIDQLIEYTNTDPEIQKFTSDLTRFPDRDHFESWVGNKDIYTLVDLEDKLLGIIWIELKEIPLENFAKDYGITLAVRTYGEARGQGYFNPFLEVALEHFNTFHNYKEISGSKGIWVSISKENTPSQRAFEKFGFRRVENETIPNRVFMVLEN